MFKVVGYEGLLLLRYKICVDLNLKIQSVEEKLWNSYQQS